MVQVHVGQLGDWRYVKAPSPIRTPPVCIRSMNVANVDWVGVHLWLSALAEWMRGFNKHRPKHERVGASLCPITRTLPR